MRKNLLSVAGAATALGFAVSLSAQTPQPQPQQPQQDQPGQHERMDARSTTVIGCLQRGEEPNTFVLTDARIVPTGQQPRGTTGVGEPGAQPDAQPGDRPGTQPGAEDRIGMGERDVEGLTYKVKADPNVNLQQHLDSQVRVEGTFTAEDLERGRHDRPGQTEGTAGRPAPGTPGTPGEPGTTPAPGAEPRTEAQRDRADTDDVAGVIQAESVQKIAEDCPADNGNDRPQPQY